MTGAHSETDPETSLRNTPYRFIAHIGRGGMGSVLEVEHVALGKRFVMKVLHRRLAHREDFARRMQSEWRALARLEHPGIVQVTDAGHTGEGRPYFVMERLEGQTVAELLQTRGPLPSRAAAEIMTGVLSGLEAAHSAGVIHRDIKPPNLFVTARGPKILDFGIAKMQRQYALVQTKDGVAIGTPRYMSPEQAAGRSVDARADIYSCGLVLFEMVAGRSPFAHLHDQNELVLAQIQEAPPRLDAVVPRVPEELADLVHRFLAKDPSHRPASARLARGELEALLPLLGPDPEGPPGSTTLHQLLSVSDQVTVGMAVEVSDTSPAGSPSGPPPVAPAPKPAPAAARAAAAARAETPSSTLTLGTPPAGMPQRGAAALASRPPVAAAARPARGGILALLGFGLLAFVVTGGALWILTPTDPGLEGSEAPDGETVPEQTPKQGPEVLSSASAGQVPSGASTAAAPAAAPSVAAPPPAARPPAAEPPAGQTPQAPPPPHREPAPAAESPAETEPRASVPPQQAPPQDGVSTDGGLPGSGLW